MNYLKTSKIYLIVALFLFIGGIKNAFAQTDCLPVDISNSCTSIERFTLASTHPDFPSCRLIYSYDLRFCSGRLQIANVTVTISQVQDPECSLTFSIFDNFFAGSVLELERFLGDFWSSALGQIADNFWAETLSSGSNAAFTCRNGIETFTVGFYRGSCISFCVGMRPNGSVEINQVSCGQTCCQELRNYCLDSQTGEEVVTIVVEQQNEGDCFPRDLPACKEGSLFQSPCFELCETN